MSEGYTREQRATIARAVRAGEDVRCPACEGRLAETRVEPRRDVAYVRRRRWLVCAGCRRSVSVDVSAAGPP